MEKILVLNSGGFDSVTLISYLATEYEEVHSMFFDYGQRNLELEKECAIKVSNKVGAIHTTVMLPKFNWSKSSVLDTEGTNEYIEMRNLIFISYAVSYAQANGIKKIALAYLYNGSYADTSPLFVENVNQMLQPLEMELLTPFSDYTKAEVGFIANFLHIKKGDYFSCNTPNNNKPCGICNDCLNLKIIEETMQEDLPIHEFIQSGFECTEKFEELFKNCPIEEARLLINSKCQFKCGHCFYGFDKPHSPELTIDDFKKIIDGCVNDLGVKNFHFSGKEPLINEDIFEYMKYIKEHHPKVTYDLVTNGVNVLKYIDKLKECSPKRICISVESINDLNIIRPTGKHIVNTIKTILKDLHNTELQVFLDMHKGNYKYLYDTMKELLKLGVTSFHIRGVMPLGSGTKIEPLSKDEMAEVFDQIVKFDEETEEAITLELNLRMNWVKQYIEDIANENADKEIHLAVANVLNDGMILYNRILVMIQLYCHPYEKQISITSDGYVLGCGTEVSNPNYSKVYPDLRKNSLKECVAIGKEMTINRLKTNYRDGDYNMPNFCYHTKPNFLIK